ncbi:hypothetical protein Tco_0424237 [Tanacetum coccineum]
MRIKPTAPLLLLSAGNHNPTHPGVVPGYLTTVVVAAVGVVGGDFRRVVESGSGDRIDPVTRSLFGLRRKSPPEKFSGGGGGRRLPDMGGREERSSLNLMTVDEVDEEEGRVEPIIFQDFSDEEGSEEGGNDVMEIDEEENEELSKLLYAHSEYKMNNVFGGVHVCYGVLETKNLAAVKLSSPEHYVDTTRWEIDIGMTVDGVDEEEGPAKPIIFQDFSDEEGFEEGVDDAMETDKEDNEELEEESV